MSEWTVNSLKEHVEVQIDALKDETCAELHAIRNQISEGDRRYSERFIGQEKAVVDALASAKEAVIKAEVASDKRFESVNEFRGQLSDQTATFIPRTEYAALRATLDEKITAVTARIDRSEGSNTGSSVTKAEMYRALAATIGVAGFVVTVVVLLVKP